MAKVFFYPARIDAQKLRNQLIAFDETKFKYLVFQAENPDAPSNRDSYDLTGFIVGPDLIANAIVGTPELTRDLDHSPFRVNDKRVAFGNYFLTRAKIDSYVNGAGSGLIDHLALLPKEYVHDKRYVCYEIISVNMTPFTSGSQIQYYKTLSGTDDLNPCPPNQPGL